MKENSAPAAGVGPVIAQRALFSDFDQPSEAPEGLQYSPDFITEGEESDFACWIDGQPWDTGFSRRRQFYGASYDDGDVSREIPTVLMSLGERLHEAGFLREVPDQVLVNEYLPGQGIAAHVDHHPEFGDEVAMVSLLDSYPMRFARAADTYEVLLERRSLCVISSPSRYEWTHEIARRRSDPIEGGGRRARGRRLSITFRKRQ